jgi:hypothetical protein
MAACSAAMRASAWCLPGAAYRPNYATDIRDRADLGLAGRKFSIEDGQPIAIDCNKQSLVAALESAPVFKLNGFHNLFGAPLALVLLQNERDHARLSVALIVVGGFSCDPQASEIFDIPSDQDQAVLVRRLGHDSVGGSLAQLFLDVANSVIPTGKNLSGGPRDTLVDEQVHRERTPKTNWRSLPAHARWRPECQQA